MNLLVIHTVLILSCSEISLCRKNVWFRYPWYTLYDHKGYLRIRNMNGEDHFLKYFSYILVVSFTIEPQALVSFKKYIFEWNKCLCIERKQSTHSWSKDCNCLWKESLANISINKMNNHLSPQIIEHKKKTMTLEKFYHWQLTWQGSKLKNLLSLTVNFTRQ